MVDGPPAGIAERKKEGIAELTKKTLSPELETLSINALRFLAADMVEAAKSGHPGLPMGAAAAAYALWTKVLRHNPSNPKWFDRDRFVLSAGHGSALLYALLHLTGYDLPLEEIKRFRQWESRTPGHPEAEITPGVEATTGPLGQGISNAVGMAAAEAHLAARFNRPGFPVIRHHTYVIASDGDLMEGVSAEACSLAGHLGLGRLIVLYDDNRISLSGSSLLCFTEDVAGRFRAYGWNVLGVDDGNDPSAVAKALAEARAQEVRPTLIRVRTHIGYGSPKKQDSSEAHGSPLGAEELKAAKAKLGWPTEPMFHLPAEALAVYRECVPEGKTLEAEWQALLAKYGKEYPDAAAELNRRMAGDPPKGWEEKIPAFSAADGNIATRKASEKILQALADPLPELFGGSADLNPSTFTWMKKQGNFEKPGTPQEHIEGAVEGGWDYAGRNLHFGVREHAMGAICNGLALHGGFIPFGSTFMVFYDYMRPAVRISAISNLHVLWIFTHDSAWLGEDGPTHQPVEHLAAMRATPNVTVLRPADASETAEAWKIALRRRHGPTILALTRQNLPVLDRTRLQSAEGTARGAYVLWESKSAKPELVLIASGSEVHPVLKAAQQLEQEGIAARVVSFPSWELFAEQDAAYRESVLPKEIPARLAVEAGAAQGWEKWVGERGAVVSIDRFGASAPLAVLQEKFGFTAEALARRAKDLLKRK
ncbi:MAG: transketolase [Anaerolineales bacterium]|nr:transketolase [Anaerolineales bacterium]